ncbi:MAG: hypothetical protein ACRDN9_04880 [Streptosporangiaceae bacterium]
MVTFQEAVDSAVRLLRQAETETDRDLMKLYDSMADTWVMLARLLYEHEERSI